MQNPLAIEKSEAKLAKQKSMSSKWNQTESRKREKKEAGD